MADVTYSLVFSRFCRLLQYTLHILDVQLLVNLLEDFIALLQPM